MDFFPRKRWPNVRSTKEVEEEYVPLKIIKPALQIKVTLRIGGPQQSPVEVILNLWRKIYEEIRINTHAPTSTYNRINEDKNFMLQIRSDSNYL